MPLVKSGKAGPEEDPPADPSLSAIKLEVRLLDKTITTITLSAILSQEPTATITKPTGHF